MRRLLVLMLWGSLIPLLLNACGTASRSTRDDTAPVSSPAAPSARATPTSLDRASTSPAVALPTAHPNPTLVAPAQPSQPTAHLLYLQTDTGDLWRMPLDGSAAEHILRLTGYRVPDRLVLAPDGDQLAYSLSTEPTALHIVQIDERSDRLVLIAPQPNQSAPIPVAFSPDGQQLAFERHVGNVEEGALGPHSALWILTLATGTFHEVASVLRTPSYVDAPFWRDNQRLLYRTSDSNTVQQSLQEPERTSIVSDGWIMELSPDRTVLLVRDRFSFDDWDIQNSASYRLISLVDDPPRAIRTWELPWTELSWATDSTRLAGYRRVDGVMQLFYRDSERIDDLRRFDVAAPDSRERPPGEYLRLPILWTPDASGLLYIVERPGGVDLRRFDLTTHSEQIIAALDQHAVLVGLQL